jgi:hypothetical protein
VTYKGAVKLLLLIFVASAVFSLVMQEVRQRKSPAGSSAAVAEAASAQPSGSSSTEQGQKVVAYYFYTTVRCVTCRKIEAFSDEAMKQGFADALREKTIEWRPVNVQLPENRHFVSDYQLFTKSLIVSRVVDGRQVEWKNLEQVWELTADKQAFVKYVQEEVRAYLRKA